MTKMNQKDAVFNAVTNVCGKVDGKCEPTKDQRAAINTILFEGFRSGAISFEGDFLADDTKLKSYVSGLQSNWLRKDKRLNGGVQYQPKHPGSRAGSGDAAVRAMRQLLTTVTDESDRAEIQAEIDKRLAEIKPAKSVEINVDALPESLRAKFVK